MKKYIHYLLFFLIVLSACTSDENVTDAPKEDFKKEVLIDAEVVGKISSAEINLLFKNVIELAGISEELIPPLQFKGITVYKLTYTTTYPGMSEKITAWVRLLFLMTVKTTPSFHTNTEPLPIQNMRLPFLAKQPATVLLL